MHLDLSRHPCFNRDSAGRFGRVHLPVAPSCNIQCNFCNRKYDCANESRPGVTSAVLSPEQALAYLDHVVTHDSSISVVGIAGPGDPFATPDKTMATLRLVRARHPEMLLCVASNGLDVEPYVAELEDLGVTHVTITVNAMTPETAAHVYAWVRYRKRIHTGTDAAHLIIERQNTALQRLAASKVMLKINTIVIPGVNDHEIDSIAYAARDIGADIMNCMPLYPAADTVFAGIPQPSDEAMDALRAHVATVLPQMTHCTRCRADACGRLNHDCTDHDALAHYAALPLKPTQDRPHIAVATREGMLVNEHLGHAEQLVIYTQADDGFKVVGVRIPPQRGGGRARWHALARQLSDCRAVLASSAGDAPREVLEETGLSVHIMEGLIVEGLRDIYATGTVSPILTARAQPCSGGCGGAGCAA
jgi:nitrogen fixation protein NifB